jgi:hypothetical protein
MDGCDERWMKNRREQTGEDPDPLISTSNNLHLFFFGLSLIYILIIIKIHTIISYLNY